MPFLKDELKNIGYLDFEFVSCSPWQVFSKKDGGTYSAGELTVRLRSTNALRKEKLFNEKFYRGFTKDLTPGCLVRAELAGEFVNWSQLPTADMPQMPQTKSNYEQVKDERSVTEHQQSFDKDKTVHDFKLGLAGIVQAMLIRGMSEQQIIMGVDMDGKECRSAKQWVKWIRETADSMASFGSDEQPSL
jgi:hypothetical protein